MSSLLSQILLVLGVVLLFIVTVLVGVNLSLNNSQLTVSQRQSGSCRNSDNLIREYCTQEAFLPFCFDMVAFVEEAIGLATKDLIVAFVRAREPQTGPLTYWAIDESTEAKTSHADRSTEGVVRFFNNTAYYYSARVHAASVACGGWSLGFWKTRPNPFVLKSIQLTYCNSSPSLMRVCSAYNLAVQNVTI